MFECGGCCIVLILIPLLCCVGAAGAAFYVNANAPDPPISDNFNPSQAEAQYFDNAVENAKTMARTTANGWFTFTFTERQLSSWLEYEGADFADEEGNVFPFHDMQVGLDDGDMTFYGKIDEIGLPIEIVIEPTIDGKGELTFEITSVDFGGLGLPTVLLDSVSDQFRDLLTQPFEEVPGDLYFDQASFYLDEGEFRIQGLVQ
ncbi:MAG: hypothetical protein K8S97_11290 [Anaerolineae bacterium]|nr:hypothetical protein [Anaerolineae bacterium]